MDPEQDEEVKRERKSTLTLREALGRHSLYSEKNKHPEVKAAQQPATIPEGKEEQPGSNKNQQQGQQQPQVTQSCCLVS